MIIEGLWFYCLSAHAMAIMIFFLAFVAGEEFMFSYRPSGLSAEALRCWRARDCPDPAAWNRS